MRIGLTFILLFCAGMLRAQVPGSILDAASPLTNPMNPNGDGFISSTNAAFTGPLDETQFELPFLPFLQYQQEPGVDNQYAAGCEFYELVQDAVAGAAYFYYQDPDGIPDNGDELMFFRFRVARYSNGSTAFSILMDSDYLFGFSGPEADPNALPGNPGFEKEIVVYNSTGAVGGVRVFNVDGKDNATVDNFHGPLSSHYQVSYALNQDPGCSDRPVFVDMYLPFSALGISSTTQVRMAVATNEDIASSLGGGASDIGGVDGNILPDDDDQFMAAITNFSPIALGNKTNAAPVAKDVNTSIEENSSNGLAVHTVSASDPNGDPLTYTIMSGNTGSAFAINSSTGQITVNDTGALDAETTSAFVLLVRVSDGLLYDNAIITLNLEDVNEWPPSISDANVSVNENVPGGSLIHTMDGTDPDATAVLSYSITGGNTGSAFQIDNSSGVISTNSAAELDFESTPTFSLAVRISDGEFTDDALIVINVTDVNEPPVVRSAVLTIEWWSRTSNPIYTVIARDPDANDVLSFAFESGNEDEVLALNPETGEIAVQNVDELKFETLTFDLEISATDRAGLTGRGTIQLTLARVRSRSNLVPVKGFSPNGDGINDFWLIEGIEAFPENDVKVFNRWGISIYEAQGYDNKRKVWRGEGKGTTNAVESTYFYIIKIADFEPVTGYIIVKP